MTSQQIRDFKKNVHKLSMESRKDLDNFRAIEEVERQPGIAFREVKDAKTDQEDCKESEGNDEKGI